MKPVKTVTHFTISTYLLHAKLHREFRISENSEKSFLRDGLVNPSFRWEKFNFVKFKLLLDSDHWIRMVFLIYRETRTAISYRSAKENYVSQRVLHTKKFYPVAYLYDPFPESYSMFHVNPWFIYSCNHFRDKETR